MREALLRHLPSRTHIGEARIILAERATDELRSSRFDNLLDLEEYIAALVGGVILIVESAGSICELGAFVKTPEISKKLVVLISSNYNNISSFIKLGALSYFSKGQDDESEIISFDWLATNEGVEAEDYILPAVVIDLLEALERVKPRGKFSIDRLGDRIYLTLSICYLLRGARMTEIKECYDAIELGGHQAEIDKHLSVLEICGYLKTVHHGQKTKYFVPLLDDFPLKVAFKKDVAVGDRNTLRWLSEVTALIKAEEPARIKLFQKHQNDT